MSTSAKHGVASIAKVPFASKKLASTRGPSNTSRMRPPSFALLAGVTSSIMHLKRQRGDALRAFKRAIVREMHVVNAGPRTRCWNASRKPSDDDSVVTHAEFTLRGPAARSPNEKSARVNRARARLCSVEALGDYVRARERGALVWVHGRGQIVMITPAFILLQVDEKPAGLQFRFDVGPLDEHARVSTGRRPF
jgi:hypothetical protein